MQGNRLSLIDFLVCFMRRMQKKKMSIGQKSRNHQYFNKMNILNKDNGNVSKVIISVSRRMNKR